MASFSNVCRIHLDVSFDPLRRPSGPTHTQLSTVGDCPSKEEEH